MSRAELKAAGVAFVAFVTDPPGWIPAWILTAHCILLQHAVAAAALYTNLELARLEFALKVVSVQADVYKTVLGLWLGYKGIGGIVSATRAVLELRAMTRAAKEPSA